MCAAQQARHQGPGEGLLDIHYSNKVQALLIQEESTKRRNDERAAEAANKSAKKARNAGHSVATAARAQDAAAAAAAEPSSVAMTGDMHVSASDGEEFAEPPVQTSVASTPHVSIATVPASQAAFGKSSEGRTQIGDQNLTADERNDDQLPDSVVQELLKQQRWAFTSL
jgi:hypothetical protein